MFNRDNIGRFSTLTIRANAWARRTGKRMGVAAVAIATAGTFTGIGFYANDATVVVNRLEAAPQKVEKKIPEVMQRIAKCESRMSQKGKNGQLQYNVNRDGTIDVGKWQINAVHFAEATRLGYDLLTEEGNEAFALHLYETKGTEPWYSTKSCWNR